MGPENVLYALHVTRVAAVVFCSDSRGYGEGYDVHLLLAAAGGNFSTDIDGSTTLLVTGTVSAGIAMDAAEGKDDRYTLALRQKLDTGRPGYDNTPQC